MHKLANEMASLSPDDQIDLHFALAKAYEDLGEHEQSANHLIKGNALKRQQINYDEGASLNLFRRIQEVFSPGLMHDKRNVGDPSPVPVFVIGMPRSGTTLVEQILASHPEVFGAGELDKISNGVAELGSENVSVCYPEMMSLMTNVRLRQFGTSYVDAISALAPKAKRITDKMPNNFLFAGLIHLMLPDARIIHVRRDPLDTCFSCFSKLFAGEQRFSYDLGELGRFYRAYESLMGIRSANVSEVDSEKPPGTKAMGRTFPLAVGVTVTLTSVEGRLGDVVMYLVISTDFLCHSEIMAK